MPLFLLWISPFLAFFNLVLPLPCLCFKEMNLPQHAPNSERAIKRAQAQGHNPEHELQISHETTPAPWQTCWALCCQVQQLRSSGTLTALHGSALCSQPHVCLPACTSLSNTPGHRKNTHTICFNSTAYAKLWLVKAPGRQVVMWLTHRGRKKLFCPLSNTDLPLMLQSISSCNSASSLFSPPCHCPYICSYRSTLSWLALKFFPHEKSQCNGAFHQEAQGHTARTLKGGLVIDKGNYRVTFAIPQFKATSALFPL